MYKKFKTIKEAGAWGAKYFGYWLKNYQKGGALRNSYDVINSHLYYLAETAEERENLIKEEKAYTAISYYCGGNTGRTINTYCRNNGLLCGGIKEEYVASFIRALDDALIDGEIPENIIAYRFISYEDLKCTQPNRLLPGRVITDKGYMGVGLVKDSLRQEHNYYDTAIKIYIPKGAKGTYLDLISRRPEEQEVLFQRGARLRILWNIKIGSKRYMGCKYIP